VSTEEAAEICKEKGETSEECLAAQEAAKEADDAEEEKTGGSG